MLARIDEAFPLLRTTCDGAMRIIIAFVADASSVCEILPTSLSRRGQPPLAGLRDRPLLSRSNGGNGSRPCGNVKSALSACSRAFEIATAALCATVGLTDLIEVVLKVALRMRLAARLPPFILPGDGALCPHCLHQQSDAHDLHDAFEVVGQHMEAHFGADARQPLGQEMRRAHPGFERAEGMFDGLPA